MDGSADGHHVQWRAAMDGTTWTKHRNCHSGDLYLRQPPGRQAASGSSATYTDSWAGLSNRTSPATPRSLRPIASNDAASFSSGAPTQNQVLVQTTDVDGLPPGLPSATSGIRAGMRRHASDSSGVIQAIRYSTRRRCETGTHVGHYLTSAAWVASAATTRSRTKDIGLWQ